MKQIEFKGFEPHQIEVRPTDTKEKGICTLLLYMGAHSAVNILNDAVGPLNWQIEYKVVNNTTFGILSIYDEEKGAWVSKEDTGSESNIEASKGLASDILKRCLARWGWNHLYTAPRIKIDCPDKYYLKINGQEKMTMTFRVAHIAYKGKQITELKIVDRFDNIVFDWKIDQPSSTVTQPIRQRASQSATPQISNEEKLKNYCTSLRGSYDDEVINKFYAFYMKSSTNSEKTIAENWKGEFDPSERWRQWLGGGKVRSNAC